MSSNEVLVRSKSRRAAVDSNKSFLGPRSGLSTATPASHPATGTGNCSPIFTSSSNVLLFLTNLRLLDLDLRPDWPDINPLTFSTKNATQGQKKRIQCVEWALYQLFAIWDPDDARTKLEPLFPPADQVQSLGLRAALLRCLEQAKKNGVLGRDAVVRRTMLDECKGDRLEEVLAVFSSAVLKKVVAERLTNEPEYPGLALTLALENLGYSAERTELGILVLAHKVSLRRLLRDKNADRARFRDFSELLDLKERTLLRRREQVKELEARQQSLSKRMTGSDGGPNVWETVRHNWSGHERWMETLLYGDCNARKDGVLSTSFDRVWRRVQADRLSELEDQAGGLLEQLDRRVKAQRDRLRGWQEFRAQMFGAASRSAQEPTESPAKPKGIDLGFRSHESLQVARSSPKKRIELAKSRSLTGEYADLVNGLREQLRELDRGKRLPSLLGERRNEGLEKQQEARDEVISDISELDEELAVPEEKHSKIGADRPPHGPPALRNLDSLDLNKAAKSRQDHGNFRPPQSQVDPVKTTYTTEVRQRKVSDAQAPAELTTPTRHSTDSKSSSSQPAKASPERPVSPVQMMADQILASVQAASPSPVKKPRHTLTLAERTRLSMGRHRSKGPGLCLGDDTDDEPELDTATDRRSKIDSARTHEATAIQQDQGELNQYEDLVARTRRSMAGFEAARQKAQLERRRSQRKSRQLAPPSRRHDGSSYFPSVDEEGNTTLLLAEELMNNDQDDYEAIFKSRPKIETSPVGTPTKTWGD